MWNPSFVHYWFLFCFSFRHIVYMHIYVGTHPPHYKTLRRSWSTIYTTSKPILRRITGWNWFWSDKKKASQWTNERLSRTHSWKEIDTQNQSRSSHSPDVMMKTERRPTLENKFRRDKVKGTRERRSHITHSEFYLSPFLHMSESAAIIVLYWWNSSSSFYYWCLL